MEPQLSVLLYSKYSSMSKSLMNLIQTSGIDFTNQFSLQSLCIDNEEIRKRIIENQQIQVTSVPCLLVIFPDGGIEKYDGPHAFEWVEDIVRKFAPPPPSQPQEPPQPSEEEQWRMQQAMEQQKMLDQKRKVAAEREQIRENNRKDYERQYEEGFDADQKEAPPPPKRNRRRVKRREPSPSPEREPAPSGVTSIDDLPSDEEDDVIADRYRSRKPVGRIRSDEGNYIEGDDLFQGEHPDMRRAGRSTVKGNAHVGNDAKSRKSVDLMAKAKEMAKGREESAAPPGHPARQRN